LSTGVIIFQFFSAGLTKQEQQVAREGKPKSKARLGLWAEQTGEGGAQQLSGAGAVQRLPGAHEAQKRRLLASGHQAAAHGRRHQGPGQDGLARGGTTRARADRGAAAGGAAQLATTWPPPQQLARAQPSHGGRCAAAGR